MSSAIVTVLYLPFTGELAEPLYGLGTVPGLAFFTAVAAGASVSVLIDRRLTVQRRWNVVTARITAFSVARPLMLFGPLTESAFAIFALAVVPPAVSGVVAWWLTSPKKWRSPSGPSRRSDARPSATRASTTRARLRRRDLLRTTYPGGTRRLPPPERGLLRGVERGRHRLPVADKRREGANGRRHARRDLARHTRIALALTAVVGVGSALAVAGGSFLITTVYGSSYSETAELLRLLAVAAVPWTVTLVAMTDSVAYRAIIFDLGGVVMPSPLDAFREYERRNGQPR